MVGNWFDDASSHLLPAGTRVGAYTIGRPLGSGAMGAVYQAHDDGGAEVALKLIHKDFDADPTARELMASEVEALQRLRHPNVVPVYDAELDGSEAFVVTALVPGKTLAQEVADGGPLDAVDLCELADQLSSALLALETAGVVHRDIKPSNIIVGENGPVLIDFGIAREASLDGAPSAHHLMVTALPGGAQSRRHDQPHTRLMGTPGYLAPELLTGAPPTATTDWWSWAAVLAFAGTGRPPFGFGLPDEVFHRELQGRVDLVGLPPRTAAALLGALGADPALRTSPAEVIQALRRDAAIATAPTAAPTQTIQPVSGHAPLHVSQVYAAQGFATQVLPPVAPIRSSAFGRANNAHPTLVMGADGANPTAVIDFGATQVLQPQVLQPQVLQPQMAGQSIPAENIGIRGSVLPTAYAARPQNDGVLPTAYAARPQNDGVLPTAYAARPQNDGALGFAHPTSTLAGAAEPFPVYQRPVSPKRAGVLAVLALPLIVAATRAPLIAFGVLAVLVVFCRIIGTFVDDLHLRRELAGQVRNSDAAVVAARSPLTLVRAILGGLPQLLVGLGSGLLTMALGWWATGARGPFPIIDQATGLTEAWVHPAILALAMAIGLLVTWFGTHSYLTRYGARLVLNTVAPGRLGIVLMLVALALLAFLLYGWYQAPTGQINWWPSVAPPLL